MSLKDYYDVYVVSSCSTLDEVKEGITIKSSLTYNNGLQKKIQFFSGKARQIKPEIIICSEPLTIWGAHKYKQKENKECKIIYDITEYYPSNQRLSKNGILKRCFLSMGMTLLNWYAAWCSTAFIFGEHYKALFYKRFFARKPSVIIPYYADLRYVSKNIIELNRPLCLGFTGNLSKEKGLFNFTSVALKLHESHPDLKLKVIGWFPNQTEEKVFFELVKNINVDFIPSVPFPDFSSYLKEIHFLFDLREKNRQNIHSLPIKIYLYAACGKPMIYSNNKAIKKEHSDIPFVHLVDPENTKKIVTIIEHYLCNKSTYVADAQAAADFAEKNYNWSSIKKEFIRFIQKV